MAGDFLPDYSTMPLNGRYRPLFKLFCTDGWKYVRKDGVPIECATAGRAGGTGPDGGDGLAHRARTTDQGRDKEGKSMKANRVIYLSGPMKGYAERNYPLFHAVTAELRAKGHRVYNPAEFPDRGPDGTFPIRQAFASYCNFICLEADTIVLLPGWEKSKGVSAEKALAENCSLDVVEWQATEMPA